MCSLHNSISIDIDNKSWEHFLMHVVIEKNGSMTCIVIMCHDLILWYLMHFVFYVHGDRMLYYDSMYVMILYGLLSLCSFQLRACTLAKGAYPNGTYTSSISGSMCACIGHVSRSITHPTLPRLEKKSSMPRLLWKDRSHGDGMWLYFFFLFIYILILYFIFFSLIQKMNLTIFFRFPLASPYSQNRRQNSSIDIVGASTQSFTWRPPFQHHLILSSPQSAPIASPWMIHLHLGCFPPRLYSYRFSFDVFDLETVGFLLSRGLESSLW